MTPPPAKVKVLYAAGAIARRVARLAKAIGAEMGDDVHLIAILKGSFVFAADLIRHRQMNTKGANWQGLIRCRGLRRK